MSRIRDLDGPDAGTSVSESTRLASCFQLLGRVEDQVRFADSKAAFLATVHTLLVGPLVYNVKPMREALTDWDFASRAVLIGVGWTYALLFLGSMVLVALAVLPRFRHDGREPSRLFFGRVAREFGDDPGRFVQFLGAMTDRDWLDELGVYVVDASRIAASKHAYVRRATVLTALSVVAWCAVVAALLGLR